MIKRSDRGFIYFSLATFLRLREFWRWDVPHVETREEKQTKRQFNWSECDAAECVYVSRKIKENDNNKHKHTHTIRRNVYIDTINPAAKWHFGFEDLFSVNNDAVFVHKLCKISLDGTAAAAYFKCTVNQHKKKKKL